MKIREERTRTEAMLDEEKREFVGKGKMDWMLYLPRCLPAVPIFKMEISPKYEPALSVARTVRPLSATTCRRPRFTMYISLPTSPVTQQCSHQPFNPTNQKPATFNIELLSKTYFGY